MGSDTRDIFLKLHHAEAVGEGRVLVDVEVMTLGSSVPVGNEVVELLLGDATQNLVTGPDGRARNQLVFPLPPTDPAELTATVGETRAVCLVAVVVERRKEEPSLPEPKRPIHDAARDGDLIELRRHVAHGASVNARGYNVIGIPGDLPLTPLQRAARAGQRDAVRFLIENGAEIDLRDAQGSTALHHATTGFHDVVRALVEAGADVNLRCNNNWTPLSIASKQGSVEVVRLLLEGGADVKPSGMGSPLWLACDRNDHAIVEILLDAGADVNSPTPRGHSPLVLLTSNNVEVFDKVITRRWR